MVVIRSIIQNKLGFSAVEALIGFFLLSSMMLIYLPGLTQNIAHFNAIQETTNQWSVFETLVKFKDSEYISATIERYNQNTDTSITNFYSDELSATLSFSDGTELFVSLTDIH